MHLGSGTVCKSSQVGCVKLDIEGIVLPYGSLVTSFLNPASGVEAWAGRDR